MVSVQEAEIREWKGKAIELKGTPKMDVDSPSPLRKSTKRGLALSLDSFNLFSSPKRLCAMAIEGLSTPDKETGNWAHFTVVLVAGA